MEDIEKLLVRTRARAMYALANNYSRVTFLALTIPNIRIYDLIYNYISRATSIVGLQFYKADGIPRRSGVVRLDNFEHFHFRF